MLQPFRGMLHRLRAPEVSGPPLGEPELFHGRAAPGKKKPRRTKAGVPEKQLLDPVTLRRQEIIDRLDQQLVRARGWTEEILPSEIKPLNQIDVLVKIYEEGRKVFDELVSHDVPNTKQLGDLEGILSQTFTMLQFAIAERLKKNPDAVGWFKKIAADFKGIGQRIEDARGRVILSRLKELTPQEREEIRQRTREESKAYDQRLVETQRRIDELTAQIREEAAMPEQAIPAEWEDHPVARNLDELVNETARLVENPDSVDQQTRADRLRYLKNEALAREDHWNQEMERKYGREAYKRTDEEKRISLRLAKMIVQALGALKDLSDAVAAVKIRPPPGEITKSLKKKAA